MERLESRVMLSGHAAGSPHVGRVSAALADSGLVHTTGVLSLADAIPLAAAAGGKVLFVEYVNDFSKSVAADVYDSATDHWATTALPLSSSSIWSESPQVAAVVGSRIVFAGGNDSQSVSIYDMANGHWSQTALGSAHWMFSSEVIGDQIIFAGGIEADHGFTRPSDAVDIYDTATGRWSSATLSGARCPVSAVVGNEVIFAGGMMYSEMQQPHTSDRVDIYNAATGKWSATTLSQSRAASVAVVNDKAVFAGGRYYDHSTVPLTSNAVDIYDASTGRWSTTTLTEARANAAVAVLDGKAIFAGGNPVLVGSGGSDGTYSKTVDMYDDVTGRWSSTHLPLAPTGGVVCIGHQAIFAASSGTGNRAEAVEIYDATTGLWSTSALPEPLMAAGAVVLGDKAIFFAAATNVASALDIYDTRTGQWSTAALSQSRKVCSVAEVGSHVLFAGGYNDDQGFIPSNVVDIFTADSSSMLAGSISRGRRGAVRVSLSNSGDAPLPGPFSVALYASTSPTLRRGMRPIGSVAVATALNAGQTMQWSVPVKLSRGMPAGGYYLIVAAVTRQSVRTLATEPMSLGGG